MIPEPKESPSDHGPKIEHPKHNNNHEMDSYAGCSETGSSSDGFDHTPLFELLEEQNQQVFTEPWYENADSTALEERREEILISLKENGFPAGISESDSDSQ